MSIAQVVLWEVPQRREADPRPSLTRLRSVYATVAFVVAALAPVLASAQIVVSDDGRAATRIPLALPPGIAGMTPILALNYVGGEDRGLGAGWALEGFSRISRCASTKAVDQTRRNVEYSDNDRLCLDGQRLIRTDAQGLVAPFPQELDAAGPWNGTAEFRLEFDRQIRIRKYVQSGYPSTTYFKVFDPTGQVRTYSSFHLSNPNAGYFQNSEIRDWYISSSSDRAGNQITYSYQQPSDATSSQWLPWQIQYRGSANVAPTIGVVLNYEDRPATEPRIRQILSDGKEIKLNKRLASVQLHDASETEVKRWLLSYSQGSHTGRSTLTALAECVASGTRCLPGYQFQYSPGSVGWAPSVSFGTTADGQSNGLTTLELYSQATGALYADFNGDGRTDILRWNDFGQGNKLFLSEGSGNYKLVPAGSGAEQFNLAATKLFGTYQSGGVTDNCYSSYVADFNGDGLSDILRYASPEIAASSYVYCSGGEQTLIYLSRGDGSFEQVVARDAQDQSPLPLLARVGDVSDNNQGGGGIWIENSGYIGIGDFNDDGLTDMILMRARRASISSIGGVENRVVCDSYKLDPCVVSLYLGRGDGSFDKTAPSFFNHPTYPSMRWMPMWGSSLISQLRDLDDDGRVDLPGLAYGEFLKNGSNADFSVAQLNDIRAVPECQHGTIATADFNADGRVDVVCNFGKYIMGGPTNRIYWQEVSIPNTSGSLYGTWGAAVILDANGDGFSDLLNCPYSTGVTEFYRSRGDGTFVGTSSLGNLGLVGDFACHPGSNPIFPGNYLGTGSAEIWKPAYGWCATGPGTCQNKLYTMVNATPPDMLTSLTLPSGAVTSVTYAQLTNTTKYSSELAATLASAGKSRHMPIRPRTDRTLASTVSQPHIETTPTMTVVTRLISDTGVGTAKRHSEYAYRGYRVATDGRGSLGFAEIRQETDAPDGLSKITVVRKKLQGHPFTGSEQVSETYLGAMSPIGQAQTGQLLSRVENVYCDQTSAAGAEALATLSAPCATTAKVVKPYLRQSVQSGWDLNGAALPVTTTTNTYSGGYLTQQVVQTAGNSPAGAQTFTSTTVNEYFADAIGGDNWLLGLLKKSTVTKKASNSLSSIATNAGSAPQATATAGP